MEVAAIDWKNVDSRFVKDEVYEHINAPQWIDFSVPDDDIDDEAWFCRSSCNHPKTVEDFLKEKEWTPALNPKLQRSATVSEILPTRRDATLKKRGMNQPFRSPNTKYNTAIEDSENRNPNLSTPPNRIGYFTKEGIKSSAERKKDTDDIRAMKNQAPRLKSTLSARNLFSGGDLLNKVAEFCNELKKLATRGKDDEGDLNGGNVEKPLLQSSQVKSEVTEKSCNNSKDKQRRKKRNEDAENTTPITVDVKNIKHKEGESLLQIRTSPPTPQGFSAGHGSSKAVPKSSHRSKPQERGILRELKPMNEAEKLDEVGHKNNQGRDAAAAAAEREARTLDVFWFLKPCTNSS